MPTFKISKKKLLRAFLIPFCFVCCVHASQKQIHENCSSEHDSSCSNRLTHSETSFLGFISMLRNCINEENSIEKARNEEKKKREIFIDQQGFLKRFTYSLQKPFEPIKDFLDQVHEVFYPRYIEGLTDKEKRLLRKSDENALAIQRGKKISLDDGICCVPSRSCCAQKDKHKHKKSMKYGGCCSQSTILENVEIPKIIITSEQITNKSDENNKK